MGNDYQKPKNSGAGDFFYWIMALCFLAWFPPIGIIMLVTRLFSGNKRGPGAGTPTMSSRRPAASPPPGPEP